MKKLLRISGILAILAGIVLAAGGIWGINFTYKNIAAEKIVTPQDSSRPNKPVAGPLTLKAQADIIREHVLKITNNQTFAQMPRQVQKVDEAGKPVMDKDGKPVMVPNTARDIWITATTLRTALQLGILSYVLSSLTILAGIAGIWIGVVFLALAKRGNLA